jgi:hypothetical protein
MTTYTVPAGFEPFLVAAEQAAASRAEVDPELAQELMAEAAQRLHNGLVVDHLDEHDQAIVIAGLAAALSDADPESALLEAVDADQSALHDPDGAVGAYLTAGAVLQL